jgi:hypothetical protein
VGKQINMSFFYGLVSQRGPFIETREDYLRLTTPGYSALLDPNTSIVKVSEIQRGGRSAGGSGDRPYPNIKSVNGLEANDGLSQGLVNALVEKVSQDGFISGEWSLDFY